jgi:benzoyl-CoA 2,3-dioxygenase component B
MSNVELNEKIPNNVGLSGDKKLQRALEQWQPAFLDWWKDMGPDRHQDNEIYLRTAVGVDAKGWANFGYVKMPDYRWGIFLADKEAGRKIGFGDHMGEDVWQEVPGEHRATLRRLIVTQADTEPASVEQQRRLCYTAPSLYDMRNLFQVNVEEGRHLWAMVYLLHTYFGRDGREEAEALLQRRSGNQDKPRILGAFNEPCPDWLAFYMFTFFTDRDGKYQLLALAESSFDPLARSCRFMLTEEAHHMFVGETGVQRVVARTAEIMKSKPGMSVEEVRKHGVIDLTLVQKYLNWWYSVSLDLFGSEISSNAASFFAQGLKGRANEEKFPEHKALDAVYPMQLWDGKAWKKEDVPMRNAMNEVLRDGYTEDCQRGVDKWNKELTNRGLPAMLKLPSHRFHRAQGVFSAFRFDPEGNPITQAEWDRRQFEWLPNETDMAYVRSLMPSAVTEPGKMANWIAPPLRGINHQPLEFEYVRLD